MNNKNLLIVLIAILLGLTTFLGGYLVAQKKNTPSLANISSNLNRFSSATAKNQIGNEPKLLRLSSVKAVEPTLSDDGKKILYSEKGTDKIFASDFSGLNNGFVKTKDKSSLNPNISGAALSKNRQKIAYLYHDKGTDEGQISIANPDGSVFKNILPTRARQLKFDWVNDNQISFYNPTGEDRDLFLLDLESKQLEKILDSSNGLKILWSPDGSKLLYSADNQLSFLNLKDKTVLAIDLSTEADRCVWSLNSFLAYCGSTSSPQADSNSTVDSLYQLDIAKKEFGLFFQPSSIDKIKIKKPLLSPAEDYLFFVNDLDGYLYRISL